jgi:hypothetical protein
MHTKFWSENPKGRALGRHGHRWEDRIDHRGEGGKVWAGCMWLRIGTSGELL